jgi:hypothetical protein
MLSPGIPDLARVAMRSVGGGHKKRALAQRHSVSRLSKLTDVSSG